MIGMFPLPLDFPVLFTNTCSTVNMPEIIAQTNMDQQSINRLKEELTKFCTWLGRNSPKFFCAKYEKPSAEYVEAAR